MIDAVTPKVDIPDASPDAGQIGVTIAPNIGRVVAFVLEGQRYALPIERVREIQQIVAFSDVPAGGKGVVGMVNLRGQVIPAVDARELVGLAPRDYNLETPMVIAETGGKLVAILVDEVKDVFALPEGCMQEAPALHELSAKMLGVARLDDGLVYILDIDQLFDADSFGRDAS